MFKNGKKKGLGLFTNIKDETYYGEFGVEGHEKPRWEIKRIKMIDPLFNGTF